MTRLEMERVNCLLIDIDASAINQATTLNALIDNQNVSLIALRHGHKICVYLNQCPHQGRRLDYAPGQFLSKDGQLICAAHGASFAMESGLCLQGPCRGESLQAFDCEIKGNQLRIFLSTDSGLKHQID